MDSPCNPFLERNVNYLAPVDMVKSDLHKVIGYIKIVIQIISILPFFLHAPVIF